VWVFRYVGLLFEWAFTHWRKHQAIVGLVGSVLVGLGILAASGLPTLAIVLGCWLGVLLLIVAPARLWRQHDLQGITKIRFVEHPDNMAFDPNAGIVYRRVTIENKLPDQPLTGAEVVLASITPMPAGFMTLSVPLTPMHASAATPFTLRPNHPQTVNLVSAYHEGADTCELWHSTAAVPHEVPDGVYRLKLVATANETTPAEQMATLIIQHVVDAIDANNAACYRISAFDLALEPVTPRTGSASAGPTGS
jgi:hypothetical protein